MPEEHREALQGYLLTRQTASPAFRWTPAENLHITVRFLGQVESVSAERIASGVEEAAPTGFALQLGGLDSFGRGRRARVLWLGLRRGAAEVADLARRVEGECAREGLEAEKRPYHPHLTLARSRRLEGAPPPEAYSPDLPAWRAEALVLYRSHLGRGGSTYEALRSIRLR